MHKEVPAIAWPWNSGPAVPGTILSVCLSVCLALAPPSVGPTRASLLSASFTESSQASLLGSQLSQQQQPLFSISRPFPTTFIHFIVCNLLIVCVCVYLSNLSLLLQQSQELLFVFPRCLANRFQQPGIACFLEG